MSLRIALNGFGRIGRLVLRAAWDRGIDNIALINDPGMSADTAAHLLVFDSVQGRWRENQVSATDTILKIGAGTIDWTSVARLEDLNLDNRNVDILIDATGRFRDPEKLQPCFDAGVQKILVSAPVKSEQALNLVMGVNDHLYDHQRHHLITAASCTTNCLAPLVQVLRETPGIRHGSMTTIHAVTNTQVLLDGGHKDLRRARAATASIIPTTTGSASAISEIFPDLKGRINGMAVRVPLLCPSLTDFVFEAQQPTSVEQINHLLKTAAAGPLQGILGYEERPLVSIDYCQDPRSAVVDAPSTMVIGGTQVKVLAWYDNEWGYVNRLVDLLHKVLASFPD